MNYQTETLDKEVQDQLLARDRYISELNRTVLDLRSELKAKEGGIKERNWEKDLEGQEKLFLESKRENAELNDKLRDIEDLYRKSLKEWEEEKENMEILNHALEEEEEGLKGILEAKETEIIELSESIKTLQLAVERHTKFNSDLLSNTDKFNTEIQVLNANYHEANMKAVRVVEMQKTLDEYITLNYNLEMKNAKLSGYADSLARFTKVTEWASENLKNIEEYSKNREASLNNITEENFAKELIDLKLFFSDAMNNLQTIRVTMQNGTPKLNSEDKTSEDILRNRIIELENEYKKLLHLYKEVTSKEAAYLEEIDRLNQDMELISLDYKNNISKMKNQIDMMKDITEKFNSRVEDFKIENEKNQSELYATRSKLAHLTGKQDHFIKKRNEFKEYEESLKAENLELKNKLLAYTKDNRAPGKGSMAEELRVKKAMSQLQILRDELFRKDTDLVKKSRQMIKLENEIENQKNNVQKLHSKMKNIEAEIISKVSLDLEEKDRQIEILKEMLRCAHSDIKLKDSQLSSMKNTERMTSPKRK